MPYVRHYNGRLIRHARKLRPEPGQPTRIRITFEGEKGKRGDQVTVTEEEFRKGRTAYYRAGSNSVTRGE